MGTTKKILIEDSKLGIDILFYIQGRMNFSSFNAAYSWD